MSYPKQYFQGIVSVPCDIFMPLIDSVPTLGQEGIGSCGVANPSPYDHELASVSHLSPIFLISRIKPLALCELDEYSSVSWAASDHPDVLVNTRR